MRSTIGIVLAFMILISGSLYISGRIENTSTSIQMELKEAKDLINQENWDQASMEINKTYETWGKIKKYWALVLNHSTLNTIEISYARIQQFTINKEKAHCLAELETLRILLNDIPESQNVKLHNII